MSDIQRTSIGYLSPVGDYGLRNSQALSGVSHLWQDFFARAMAEQVGDAPKQAVAELPIDGPIEPTAGAETLAQIVDQLHCEVTDNPVRPPEPLFLPIAEFELDLLPKPAIPYDEPTLVKQQQALDYDQNWARPLVAHNLRLAA